MIEASLQTVTAGQFSELVGTEFRVVGVDQGHQVLVLTSLTPPCASGAQYESFSLFFHGGADRPLVQRTYIFEHDRLGRFQLFIVPVGKEEGRMQYEAVFNRRRDG